MRPSPVLLPALLILLLSPSSSAQSSGTLYNVIFDNLSDLTLNLQLCTAIECVPKSPRRYETLGPKAVAVYGVEDDLWEKHYMLITDAASGRKLGRTLWDPSNPANIVSILQKSPPVTEISFSDLSMKNVLLGVLH